MTHCYLQNRRKPKNRPPKKPPNGTNAGVELLTTEAAIDGVLLELSVVEPPLEPLADPLPEPLPEPLPSLVAPSHPWSPPLLPSLTV